MHIISAEENHHSTTITISHPKPKERKRLQCKRRGGSRRNHIRCATTIDSPMISFLHTEKLYVIRLSCYHASISTHFMASLGLSHWQLVVGLFPFRFRKFFGERAIYVIASILKCRFCGIESLLPSCRDRERS